MKALTVQQPWAWAIIHGGKDIENRSWRTHYRGPVAIHAAQGLDDSAFNRTLVERRDREGPDADLPRGAVVGTAYLLTVHHASECMAYVGEVCSAWARPGMWHWFLSARRALPEPIPYTGRLGLWDLPDDVLGGAA